MLIAQLSDPHIRPAGVLYQDVADSNASFAAAIAHLNALNPQPDLVLLSGDVVDHGAADEYANARALLAPLRIPYLVIPGNHDEREALRLAFRDHRYLPATGPLHYVAGEYGPVRIVALDVTLPGLHHGTVDDDSLAWLDHALAAEPDRPTLIMMHQPPFATGVPYMDKYWCQGGDRLASVVARYPAIERIVCGHLHRSMQVRFGGTLLCIAPSTTTTIALNFAPDAKPRSYIEPPAFLLHRWTPETGMVTHHCLVGTFPGPFAFA